MISRKSIWTKPSWLWLRSPFIFQGVSVSHATEIPIKRGGRKQTIFENNTTPWVLIFFLITMLWVVWHFNNTLLYSWWFFTNPSEKYANRQIGSFPQGLGWKYQKYLLKPPPSLVLKTNWANVCQDFFYVCSFDTLQVWQFNCWKFEQDHTQNFTNETYYHNYPKFHQHISPYPPPISITSFKSNRFSHQKPLNTLFRMNSVLFFFDLNRLNPLLKNPERVGFFHECMYPPLGHPTSKTLCSYNHSQVGAPIWRVSKPVAGAQFLPGTPKTSMKPKKGHGNLSWMTFPKSFSEKWWVKSSFPSHPSIHPIFQTGICWVVPLPRIPVTTRMTWTIFRFGDPNLNLHFPLASWEGGQLKWYWLASWWFFSTHLRKTFVKMDHFPK